MRNRPKPIAGLVAIVVCAAGCTCGSPLPGTLDPPVGSDAASPEDAGEAPADAAYVTPGPDAGVSCGATTCATDQVCRFDTCLAPLAPCTSDSRCANDSYCHAGECVPYGLGPRGATNPSCKRLLVLGLFAPQAQCEWTEPPAGDPYPLHRNVLSTPLVVDFNLDDDSSTLKPSIVFVTYNCDDGGSGQEAGCFGVIRVIDGATCQQQFSAGGPGDTQIIGSVTPAAGDFTGDGRPDIVAANRRGGILGFTYDPSANGGGGGFVKAWTNGAAFNALNAHWDSLSLHDLDDDGVPEIIQAGPFPAAYDAKGQLIHGSAVSTRYSQQVHPVLADVDADGSVDLLDGKNVHRFNKTTRQWEVSSTSSQPLGHVAIADFGTFGPSAGGDARGTLDGVPELAVVTSGTVRVQTLSGRVVFGPVGLPGGGTGGPPTAGDFDGDGRVEIGVAGASAYSVFDPDCLAGSAPSLCPTGYAGGVLWSKTSQDASSNVTGSSVFDFEADGRAEVVYADECFSRVYDGRTGEVLFSQHHTSCTWYENPIVADVDGDFRSEVVIPSNSSCNVTCPALDPIDSGARCDGPGDCPGTTTCVKEQPADKIGRCRCEKSSDCGSKTLDCVDPTAGPSPRGKVCRALHPTGTPKRGVLVLRDVLDRWVGSRPIWNQHAYSVTHVRDDGTIPRTSQVKANWKDPKLNNFRMNVQGALDPETSPDLTSGAAATRFACKGGALELSARVCNRGTGPVAAGLPVTFYEETKAPARRICTARTVKALAPGACEAVTCGWASAPRSPRDVLVSADDDGSGKGVSRECEEENNQTTLRGVVCSAPN